VGLFYFIAERRGVFADLDTVHGLLNAIFHSVTARTAGFQTSSQTVFCETSKTVSCMLMFVGGAPGSVSGGLKVTTVFVILTVMMRRPDALGDIRVGRHRLSAQTINNAVVYFIKAGFLLFIFILALFISESGSDAKATAIVFEVISAFATAGLSLDFTPTLTDAGKIVIIAAMFAGRVGLVALAFPSARHKNFAITYPEGELLI
jgi:trk system potassium uptake protein TrkH